MGGGGGGKGAAGGKKVMFLQKAVTRDAKVSRASAAVASGSSSCHSGTVPGGGWGEGGLRTSCF